MKKFRIVTVLLALCLITSSFVGGTFAKYTSTVTGSDTAVVAQWKIGYTPNNGTEGAKVDIPTVANSEVTFDLFNTIKDTGADDANVKNATNAEVATKQIIAPGTTGAFTFKITNESEVTASYTVTFSDDDTTIPLQYSIDGNNWEDSIADLTITGAVSYDNVNTTDYDDREATHTVYWRWVFDNELLNADGHENQTNDTDTALGTAATAPEVTVTATINVEQVD